MTLLLLVMIGRNNNYSQHLAKEFEIKTLEKWKYFFEIEVASSKGIIISEQKYVTNFLKETGREACKHISTTMDSNIKLFYANDRVAVDNERYQHQVGKFVYLPYTRPNIALLVWFVSLYIAQEKSTYRILQNFNI
ncbi:hypothetical protein V8G54_004116 [Vigna mungo]|uniref:Reverse transcriptase Ty1/copia-type domain-containing protein n=1 Tax=Vigna mungo TaxID=3915 RepID=A0AAQ3PD93_VIGMU